MPEKTFYFLIDPSFSRFFRLSLMISLYLRTLASTKPRIFAANSPALTSSLINKFINWHRQHYYFILCLSSCLSTYKTKPGRNSNLACSVKSRFLPIMQKSRAGELTLLVKRFSLLERRFRLGYFPEPQPGLSTQPPGCFFSMICDDQIRSGTLDRGQCLESDCTLV